MLRRDFLQLLGMTAAATALAPASLVQAAQPKAPAVLQSRYALHGQPGYWMTPYVLDAPANQPCRAQFVLPDDAPASLCAYMIGLRGGNEIEQVIVEQVHSNLLTKPTPSERVSMTAGPFDAAIFNVQEYFCPVDWGSIRRDRPLEIDYASMVPGKDSALLLALFYQVVDTQRSCPSWPAYVPILPSPSPTP